MKGINFDSCPTGNEFYLGASKKESIIYNNKLYMVKYPVKDKNTRTELNRTYSNGVLSEYVSCSIINSLDIAGIVAQNTLLGMRNGKMVVACEDFTTDNEKLISYGMVQNSYIQSDQIGKNPILEDVLDTIENHDSFKNRDDIKCNFWDTFIIDAFLGNFDRHSGNWGYLNNRKTGEIRCSPIYDCGSCLYPQLGDEGMKIILDDEIEIEKRWKIFPNSAIKIKSTGEKVNYFKFISSLENKDCNKSLKKITPKINMEKVSEIINQTPYITDIQKQFYKTMLEKRYENILVNSYNKLLIMERNKNKQILKIKNIDSLEREI